ncbi:MAG: DUF2934 domain-containing protein [Acidobacteria bacterium]|nr:DUF2934 domain-containing protein [Acidobacteriota bacterium]
MGVLSAHEEGSGVLYSDGKGRARVPDERVTGAKPATPWWYRNETRGHQHGRDLDDWLQAEDELRKKPERNERSGTS